MQIKNFVVLDQAFHNRILVENMSTCNKHVEDTFSNQ